MATLSGIIRHWRRFSLFKNNFCCLCQKSVGNFLPYSSGGESRPQLMVALNVVGSDVDNFSCPNCLSHDRERHLFLYLDKLGILDTFRRAKILHFAPEQRLSEVIQALSPEVYVKADLFPAHESIERVDMLDIPYAEASFDYVIANHVLEHVDNDLLALKEIHRVLVPGGFAILQTPYSAILENTFEDAGIAGDYARLQAYGQSDHVRLYGKNIASRISTAGFVTRMVTHEQVLSHIAAPRYGVNVNEPLFLFEKSF